jgi:transposase
VAQLLRADLLPEAWIAPPAVRQLRAQLRHRASLVRLGTGLRNRIHAVAADHGYDRAGSYWTGPGRGWLAELDLPPVSREIVTDCLASIDALAPVIERTRRRAAPAREGRPARKDAQDAAGRRRIHRAGHAGRDR